MKTIQHYPIVRRVKQIIGNVKSMDVSGYKDDFVARRIKARMIALGIKSYSEYLRYLQSNRSEVDKLLDSLSINVSEFFRDPWVWNVLSTILKKIIFSKKIKVVRIWSAGCSKGEEPYTISILLHEILGSKIKEYSITIYATDIDKDALKWGEKGVYEESSLKNVSKALLRKYFVKIGPTTYIVKPEIKRIIKFRRHDMIKDPPYMFLDAVFCRNVLIYFNKELQESVLRKFHYALREGGILVLGASEYIFGNVLKLFKPLNTRARIFLKPTYLNS